MPSKKSRFIQRCVADVSGKGGNLSSAFAICTAQSQKSGYSEPGSVKQTGKGKAREKHFKEQPDMEKKAKEYERVVKASRKEEMSTILSNMRVEAYEDSHPGSADFSAQLDMVNTLWARIQHLRARIYGAGTPYDAKGKRERDALNKEHTDAVEKLDRALLVAVRKFDDWKA